MGMQFIVARTFTTPIALDNKSKGSKDNSVTFASFPLILFSLYALCYQIATSFTSANKDSGLSGSSPPHLTSSSTSTHTLLLHSRCPTNPGNLTSEQSSVFRLSMPLSLFLSMSPKRLA